MPELKICCSSKERDELDEEEDEKKLEAESHCKKRLAIFPSPVGMLIFFTVRSPLVRAKQRGAGARI
jgi:hypothetical protein